MMAEGAPFKQAHCRLPSLLPCSSALVSWCSYGILFKNPISLKHNFVDTSRWLWRNAQPLWRPRLISFPSFFFFFKGGSKGLFHEKILWLKAGMHQPLERKGPAERGVNEQEAQPEEAGSSWVPQQVRNLFRCSEASTVTIKSLPS